MSTPYSPRSTASGIVTPSSVQSRNLAQSNISRVLPRQNSVGALRGTQLVGSKGAKIDAANNRIVLSASDGSSVGIGDIPGFPNEVGFFTLSPTGILTYKVVNGVAYYYDTDGSLLLKIEAGTLFFYDKNTEDNYMQAGVLPDATTGWAVASAGNEVADGFS